MSYQCVSLPNCNNICNCNKKSENLLGKGLMTFSVMIFLEDGVRSSEMLWVLWILLTIQTRGSSCSLGCDGYNGLENENWLDSGLGSNIGPRHTDTRLGPRRLCWSGRAWSVSHIGPRLFIISKGSGANTASLWRGEWGKENREGHKVATGANFLNTSGLNSISANYDNVDSQWLG